MTVNGLVSVLGVFGALVMAFCLVPFLVFIVFPFFNSLTAEKRLEKFINDQCLQGNEIAIRIKRDKIRFYDNTDYALVRSAIQGNEHAIRALKLDPESQKNKFL